MATSSLGSLLEALARRGYRLIGPTVRDGAIVLAEIASDHRFPSGLIDRQHAGGYRLEETRDHRHFDYGPGAVSFKPFLHPAESSLLRVRRHEDRLVFEPAPPPAHPLAFIGARACDIAALAIHDRVLGEQDPQYAARRRDLFILAVQCARSGDLCFCVSTSSGPRAEHGFDLALTELEDRFLVEVGTERGRAVLDDVDHRPATAAQKAGAKRHWQRAVEGQTRTLDAQKARALLPSRPDHPRWREVANRCLTCGNCTMVCPTCFCTTTAERTPVGSTEAERVQLWDSCFSLDFSLMHGGPVRSSPASRYRHWLNHKLSTWHDQFGTPGCVGCGRCVAWCPAAIDLLEEARAIYESPQ